MAWKFYDANGSEIQGIGVGAVATANIADDAVTYAKLQNLATADRVLGSTSTGLIGEVQVVSDMIAANAVTGDKIALGSDAAGDIMYYNGTDYVRLAKPGTPAGEALTFATSATAPSWVAASAGVGLGMVIALGG